ESSDAEAEDEDYGSEKEPASRKKPIPRKTSPSSSGTGKGPDQLARPGQKTGYGPGIQVIIKKPKARPAGKTPYSDDTIHPNTMLFLQELKTNNSRQWLK
ncbi:hypothetical protein LTR53_020032, partial [Teratosphaeriaceae sp. CCFEE 6253]